MKFVLCLSVVATACVSTAGFSTSSPTATAAGNVTIPNVIKLKKDDAVAALRRAGLQGDIDFDDSLCGSTVDGKIIELGEVCYQHPAAGQRQGARLVVSLRGQTEDPRHGEIGRNNEWRLMPNVVGMTYDEAVAAMRRAGFERTERIQSTISDDAGCKPNLVCRQYPDALMRAGLDDGKILYVGAAPAAARPSVATSAPAPQPQAPPQPQVATHEPAQPTKPAVEQAPPAFFGAPAPASPPPSSEPKRHGGNGAAAYRDGDGRVHGPGGPVFMGRDEPCTAKLDHCMRPGVWFAADDIIAGKMFRGVPVFQLDNKWWTWRGDEVAPKHLLRTAVVDKADQLQAGKPVVFFVDEGGQRFLDSEYDMLTSSRWSVAVIESISAAGVRIQGWGEVPLDTIRMIVEQK